MANQARTAIEMADFPGLMLSVDPRDMPDGAADEQTNLTCVVIGELTVRLGIKEVTFE